MIITRWYDLINLKIFIFASLKDICIILWKKNLIRKKVEEETLKMISQLQYRYFLR